MPLRTAVKNAIREGLESPAFWWNAPPGQIKKASTGQSFRFQNYRIYATVMDIFLQSFLRDQPLFCRAVLHPHLFPFIDAHFRFLEENALQLRFSVTPGVARYDCIGNSLVFVLGLPLERLFLVPREQVCVELLRKSSINVYHVRYDGPDRAEVGYCLKFTDIFAANLCVEGFTDRRTGEAVAWQSPATASKFSFMLIKGVGSLAQMEAIAEESREITDQDYAYRFPTPKPRTLRLFLTDVNDTHRAQTGNSLLHF